MPQEAVLEKAKRQKKKKKERKKKETKKQNKLTKQTKTDSEMQRTDWCLPGWREDGEE